MLRHRRLGPLIPGTRIARIRTGTRNFTVPMCDRRTMDSSAREGEASCPSHSLRPEEPGPEKPAELGQERREGEMRILSFFVSSMGAWRFSECRAQPHAAWRVRSHKT